MARLVQVGLVMQVCALLEGTLSVQILLVGLLVLVDCKASLENYHSQQGGHTANAGEPTQTGLRQEGEPVEWTVVAALVAAGVVRFARGRADRVGAVQVDLEIVRQLRVLFVIGIGGQRIDNTRRACGCGKAGGADRFGRCLYRGWRLRRIVAAGDLGWGT